MKPLSLVVSNASRLAITTDMWTSSNQKKGFMAVTAHFIDNSWTLQNRILRKISSITVDNCSTNDAMIDLLWDKLDNTSPMFGGDLFHMRCYADILNLIVKDRLDVIKVGIEKIRDRVAYWTASPKREEIFEETVRQLNVGSTKKLGLDCATRWNSTFLMLQTTLIYKDVFNRLSKRDAQYNSLPSEREWGFARDVCQKVKIFFKVIREMAKRMVKKFEGVSAVLDPRYKINVLEFYFKLLFPTTYKEEVEKVRALCYKLLKEYQSPSSTMEVIGDSSSQLGSIEDESLSKYDVYMLRELKRRRTVDTAKLELDHYLSEHALPKSVGFGVLNWWKSHQSNTSGRLVSPHCSRFHPDTMETLMCAQSWLWAEEMKGESTSGYATIYDDAELGDSCVTREMWMQEQGYYCGEWSVDVLR
ncbi:hypothetical protein RHSIM_Rhsim01G0019200 [Rhododendron simsii]|uniref:Uncharacterized protein n=1 Tax=Rhododendron simsii TaxID=118357 RepID=A0A834HHW5_RHOSS|nr:hypothetical protein RHSIM_Rhsim01G0019200 [Rhododendron simsii]